MCRGKAGCTSGEDDFSADNGINNGDDDVNDTNPRPSGGG